MRTLEKVFYESRWIIFLLGVAFVAELFGVIPGSSTMLPSALVVIYFIGFALVTRFVIVRRELNKVIAGIVSAVLYLGYFLLMSVVFNVSSYRPSMLFFLCLVAAFKILIFQQENSNQ